MSSSTESARRPVRAPRRLVDLRVPLVRDPLHLPWRCRPVATRDELPTAAVLDMARAVGDRPGAFVAGGGEPLKRGDLLELLAGLAQLRPAALGLWSTGQGLTATIARQLRTAGLERLHVPFHCGRQDAHDWLVGRTGALKTALRAIQACREAGLPVVAEVVLTRPTMAHLAETIEVLARVGVRTVTVRRLMAQDTDGSEFVALAPRLDLLGTSLEHAAATALARGVALRLLDLPPCVAPRLRPLFAGPESELWVQADGAARSRWQPAIGCPTCPGPPRCAGAPADYVARFGWEEFGDRAAAAPRIAETVADQQQRVHGSGTITLSWGGPHRVRCEACGDPALDRSTNPPAYEPTRGIRARLVRAARHRPSVLRLAGADLLAHPEAALLLYDAVRLFPRVEVAGEASPIVDWSDLDFRRLKELGRIDVALYGPDAATHDAHCGIPGAFAAMLRAVERVRAKSSIQIGAYAILHDARLVPAFAAAWAAGTLPGTPRFRLSARGGSLDELAACAAELAPGPARTALEAVLPRCGAGARDGGQPGGTGSTPPAMQTIACGRSLPHQPAGSDPIGAFEACGEAPQGCTTPGCPGMAVGWHSTTRAQRWSGNSR